MAKQSSTVLIIEDEPMISSMYQTKFGMEGFTVATAGDGQDGLEKARTLAPAVILLDIILPKLDGFAVLQEIRKDDQISKTPVILLSNLGQDEDVKKGKELGADDYFVKSNHTPAEIVDKVKALIGAPVKGKKS